MFSLFRCCALCVFGLVLTVSMSAGGAFADQSQIRAIAKTLPSSWIKVRKQAVGNLPLTYIEPINGDFSKRRTRTIADHKGKIVVLNFWATWCGPCIVEKPRLDKLAVQLNPQRFDVVSLNYNSKRDTIAKVQRFYKRFKIRNLPFRRDATPGNVRKAPFWISGIPASFIIDPKGRIIAEIHTVAWNDKRMRAFLSALESYYY